MILRNPRSYQVSLSLLIALAAAACGKIPGAGKEKDESSDEGGGKGTDEGPAEVGMVPVEGNEPVIMAGTLALDTALTGDAPDKVVAFTLANGEVQTGGEGGFQVADVDSNGKFKLSIPRVSPMVVAIESSINADGSVDRNKLREKLKMEIPEGITDAEIKAYAEEMKAKASQGGLMTILVSMKSAPGDRLAEAKSFCYIGMPHGDQQLNGIPAKAAKGHMNVGQVSRVGDEQCKTELAASVDTFAVDDATLSAMASLSDVMKQVRNYWINFNPETGESYEAKPFFMWLSDVAKVKGAYSTIADTPFRGWGLYFAVRNGPLTFGDICAYKKQYVPVKLLPPEGVEINGGEQAGMVTRDHPWTNEGVSGQVQTESSRMNCFGTNFYGAGKDENDQELMLNWGTGGSATGTIPQGYFEFYAFEPERRLATFEIGSSSPFDQDGNSKVPVPVLKLTTDAAGKIERAEVKFYVRGEEANAEAFKSIVSGLYLGLDERLEGSQNTFDKQYDLLGTNDGNTFVLDAAHFISKKDGGGKDGSKDGGDAASQTADIWAVQGSATPAGGHVATSIAVYYEMFGASYRVEFRPGGQMN